MSEEKGWIKLHRKIQDCWIWSDKPFDKGRAWIDLLLLAMHRDKKLLINDELLTIERGSFMTSILKLSERWGWSRNKTTRFLNELENEQMLHTKRTPKGTLLTIENYGIYQSGDTTDDTTESTTHETTHGATDETQKKNIKNVKNERNNNIGRFTPPSVEQVREYCKERNNKVDAQAFVDFYASKNWMIGKNKMKDWKASVRTWERNQTRPEKTAERGNKFNNFEGRNYNMDSLEQQLLNN